MLSPALSWVTWSPSKPDLCCVAGLTSKTLASVIPPYSLCSIGHHLWSYFYLSMSGVVPQILFSPDPETQKNRGAGEIPEPCLGLIGMLMNVLAVHVMNVLDK